MYFFDIFDILKYQGLLLLL